MKVFRSLPAVARYLNQGVGGSVVTIGNFDGVHVGHQAMLSSAREHADKMALPLLVLSFDPHPEAYFAEGTAPARLSSLSERVLMLKNSGVDIACIVPFDSELAAIEYQAFDEQVLNQQLQAKCVVVGDDFRYGTGRKGNGSSLSTAAEKHGFKLIQLDSITRNAHRISSTHIRQLLESGQLDKAAELLGQRYSIMGRVSYGDARGRTWGFPTLNLQMRYARALKGVFAVQLTGLDGKRYNGVANLGKRPTVGGVKTLLEVHLFNYSGIAYGKRVCVEFFAQIRREQKFDSFEALKEQIQRDIVKAKIYFEQHDV